MLEGKTVLQNLLDWMRLNQSENLDAIEKISSMIELERSQIEESFHQAQLVMINIAKEYIRIKEVDEEDREDAQEYYRSKYIFNDNVIREREN